MAHPFRIIVCGEGGQGAQSIAKIIAEAAWEQGLKSVYVPYFSTEKRGGVTIAYAQVGEAEAVYPKFSKADMWVALSQRSVDRIYDYLHDESVVLVNSFLVRDVSKLERWGPHQVNAGAIALEELGSARVFNVVVMGAMVKRIPGLSKEGFKAALRKTFEKHYKKKPELEALNEKAFERGYELG